MDDTDGLGDGKRDVGGGGSAYVDWRRVGTGLRTVGGIGSAVPEVGAVRPFFERVFGATAIMR